MRRAEKLKQAGVTQYHAVCTSADVASCVPDCNTELQKALRSRHGPPCPGWDGGGAAWAAASPPQGPKTAEKRPFSDSALSERMEMRPFFVDAALLPLSADCPSSCNGF